MGFAKIANCVFAVAKNTNYLLKAPQLTYQHHFFGFEEILFVNA